MNTMPLSSPAKTKYWRSPFLTQKKFIPSASVKISPRKRVVTPPSAPELHIAMPGSRPGVIITDCHEAEGAQGYITIISSCPAPCLGKRSSQLELNTAAGNFILHASSGSKAVIEGLTSGTRYYVRKYAFNAAGTSFFSETLSIVAP